MRDSETMPRLRLAATSSSSQLSPFGMQAERCQSLQFVFFFFFFQEKPSFLCKFSNFKKFGETKERGLWAGLGPETVIPLSR